MAVVRSLRPWLSSVAYTSFAPSPLPRLSSAASLVAFAVGLAWRGRPHERDCHSPCHAPSLSPDASVAGCRRAYVSVEEAKNHAAVFALHRANRDKPMHLVLPPGYREYWMQLVREKEKERKAVRLASQRI